MSHSKDTVAQLKIKIHGLNRSWTEKYCLGATSLTSGVALALQFIPFRQLILGANFQIYDAPVSMMDNAKQRKRTITSPVLGLKTDTEVAATPSALEPCNNPTVCLDVSYETLAGRWNTRQLRGIRDTWITNDALGFAPTIPTILVAGTDDVAGLTKDVALGNFLYAISSFTSLAYTTNTTPSGSVELANWTAFSFTKISHRDTGVGREFRGRQAA